MTAHTPPPAPHSCFRWSTPLTGALATALLAACGTGDYGAKTTQRTVASLRLVGEQRIALGQDVAGTPAGGFSGIDYDPANNTWVLQSDDRSELAPARFYYAQLRYDGTSFSDVTLTDVRFFKQPDGSNYPNLSSYTAAGGELPDFEAIRFDPVGGDIWYTSEGGRALGLGLHPFVRQATPAGTHASSLPTPDLLRVSPTEELGTRNNAGFEGLTFAADGKSLWAAMEGPIYQDGELPTLTSGAMSRLTRLDRTGAVLEQVAYPLDRIPASPAAGKRGDRGISEILAVNDRELLVLERSGIEGVDGLFKNYVRLYQIDTIGASDVRTVASLNTTGFTPVSKRLILDLNTLGLDRLDNIEGMAWGPKLPNGHDTVVMISDDNFSAHQVTQLLAFEVTPR